MIDTNNDQLPAHQQDFANLFRLYQASLARQRELERQLDDKNDQLFKLTQSEYQLEQAQNKLSNIAQTVEYIKQVRKQKLDKIIKKFNRALKNTLVNDLELIQRYSGNMLKLISDSVILHYDPAVDIINLSQVTNPKDKHKLISAVSDRILRDTYHKMLGQVPGYKHNEFTRLWNQNMIYRAENAERFLDQKADKVKKEAELLRADFPLILKIIKERVQLICQEYFPKLLEEMQEILAYIDQIELEGIEYKKRKPRLKQTPVAVEPITPIMSPQQRLHMRAMQPVFSDIIAQRYQLFSDIRVHHQHVPISNEDLLKQSLQDRRTRIEESDNELEITDWSSESVETSVEESSDEENEKLRFF